MYKPFHYIADIGVDVGVVRLILPWNLCTTSTLLTTRSLLTWIIGSFIFTFQLTSGPIFILKDQNLVALLMLTSGSMYVLTSCHTMPKANHRRLSIFPLDRTQILLGLYSSTVQDSSTIYCKLLGLRIHPHKIRVTRIPR